MELQRATKEGVLELDRISAKIGSTVNAVWGTIEGDITKQTDLQDELKKVKDSIPTKVPADGGNADTVNGHTVECDVPAYAKFTDTVKKLIGIFHCILLVFSIFVERSKEKMKLTIYFLCHD